MSKLRAIDLYSGVGGWTLGLRMAGVEVVRSYEWWSVASATHAANFGSNDSLCDIRKLSLAELPTNIDIVVGSPPCTQFSYSNRGGNGNLADGLVDVEKFLDIVEFLKPRFWAMENVPRVAGILQRELQPSGRLERYSSLFNFLDIVDMSEYGLPQRRERMIAGSFPFDLLFSYRGELPRRSLGDVLSALNSTTPFDPVYDFVMDGRRVTDHVLELPLTPEEERMNRDSKTYHPVYNRMSFPDRKDVPARTITATCTRVSRESCIVENSDGVGFRRLTIRERASLQGFPVTFQFLGSRHGDRVKQVGNAIPPLFTYLLASAFQSKALDGFEFPPNPKSVTCEVDNNSAPPELPGRQVSVNRRFVAAIPGLRFGSGMRFQLANVVENGTVSWVTSFHYGPSKSHAGRTFDAALVDSLLADFRFTRLHAAMNECVRSMHSELGTQSLIHLQERWSNRGAAGGPFAVVDRLGEFAARLSLALDSSVLEPAGDWVLEWISQRSGSDRTPKTRKLERLADRILVGVFVCACFNRVTNQCAAPTEAGDVELAIVG